MNIDWRTNLGLDTYLEDPRLSEASSNEEALGGDDNIDIASGGVR